MRREALEANRQMYLPAEEDLYLLLSFYDTYTHIYIIRTH